MSLRNKLIRLAYENPSLRGDILPLIKSAKKVQVVNRETGNTVSVNEETLKDPEKKKLYAPVEENSEKNDDGASGSSSAPKSNIFKEQSKRKSDLEKWVEENDVDDILSELDFDDIMDLENEWEDALYNLEEEDEDKAEEFKKKMEEFFKGEEKQMEIRDKIETMSDDLENDDSSKGKFILKMLDGMGADPEDQLQNLKDVLFYVKGGYEQRKKRKDKLNKDTIDQIKTFEREEVSKSMGKFHLSKEDQQKALEEYIGEIERVMGGETKSKGKKATLRSSLIRLAYEQPQLREDLLPLIKSAGNKSIGFALSFSPLDIAEKEQEIEKIIRRNFKGSMRDYNYFVNTSVGDVPVLYISDSKGNGVSGTMFNNDWRDVIQALVRAKYLSVANFQKGISLAMRQKAYIPDA